MIQNAVFIDSSIALTSNGRIGQAYAPEILAMIGRGQIQAVSNTLVLQEIADSPGAANGLAETFNALMLRILGVTQVDCNVARSLATHYPGRSPRVYVHASVMCRHGISDVYALDNAGYQGLPGIRPLPLAPWAATKINGN